LMSDPHIISSMSRLSRDRARKSAAVRDHQAQKGVVIIFT
jgi:hypothetical protein